jgi:hypothetical protein
MLNLPVCRSLAILIGGIIAVVLVLDLAPRRAVGLPLYARQTGQPCGTCHTDFLELTPFGRLFKLGGYTLGGGDWKGPPFAVMLQPTFTNTQAAQPGGAAPGFGVNNNFVLQEASLFTGGKITDNPGAFIQGTSDGVAHSFHWDNTDIRLAKQVNVDGHTLLWGGTRPLLFGCRAFGLKRHSPRNTCVRPLTPKPPIQPLSLGPAPDFAWRFSSSASSQR